MGQPFKRESRPSGVGYVAVSVAICGACARRAAIGERSGQRNGFDDMAARFRAAGWLIGRERRADRCPACRRPRAAKPQETSARPATNPGKETPMPAEPPREPTTADRRRIREALDEHYDEAAGRWRGARSDRTVAEALNVPAKWVADLREAMGLGPDANDQAQVRRELFEAVRAEIAAAEATALKAFDLVDAANKRMRRLEVDLGYAPKAAG